MVVLIVVGVLLVVFGMAGVAAGGWAAVAGWLLIALTIGTVAVFRLKVAAAMAASVVVVVGTALTAAPTEEAPPAPWMRDGIGAGRESIWWTYDPVRGGSPLVFTGARCRADGAFLAFYAHNWFWVWPEQLVSEMPPNWREYPAGSRFAGGYAEALATEYGDDLARYFAEHREVPCESRS